MEPEQLEQEAPVNNTQSTLYQVTPLSKYLAMVLFIMLPFIGGWIGYSYATEKVIEVEREVVVDHCSSSLTGSGKGQLVEMELIADGQNPEYEGLTKSYFKKDIEVLDRYYEKDEEGVYFVLGTTKPIDRNYRARYLLKGVDPETFRVFEGSKYAADDNAVYVHTDYNVNVLPDADPLTFNLIPNVLSDYFEYSNFAVDKNKVYVYSPMKQVNCSEDKAGDYWDCIYNNTLLNIYTLEGVSFTY